MLFSIFTYIIFGITLAILACQDVAMSRSVPKYRYRFTSYSWIYIFVFTLVSGLRFRLGADCEEYVYSYVHAHFYESYSKGEYLFGSLSSFLYNLGVGRVGFLGFWAFVEIVFFYAALRARKYLLPFVSLVLVLGPHYYDWMNGIRQMVVTCMFVYAIQQKIDNNKYVLYAILIYIGSFIHHSSLLLFVFLIVPNIDYFNNKIFNKYVIISLVIISAVLGQSGWVKEPLNALSLLLGDVDTGYEGYTGRMQWFTEELATNMSYGPRRLIILFVSLLIIWYYPKMKEYYNDKFLIFSYTVFVLFAIFPENILSSVHSSMSRPFMYFKPFKLICNAYLLFYLQHQYRKHPLVFYMVLALSICYMIIDNITEASNPEESTLFKFVD